MIDWETIKEMIPKGHSGANRDLRCDHSFAQKIE
jgi:hypothetical protein